MPTWFFPAIAAWLCTLGVLLTIWAATNPRRRTRR